MESRTRTQTTREFVLYRWSIHRCYQSSDWLNILCSQADHPGEDSVKVMDSVVKSSKKMHDYERIASHSYIDHRKSVRRPTLLELLRRNHGRERISTLAKNFLKESVDVLFECFSVGERDAQRRSGGEERERIAYLTEPPVRWLG